MRVPIPDNNSNHLRPTFDVFRNEHKAFIGPPSPPQIPKFTPVSERAAVDQMMLDDLNIRIAEESKEALGK